MFDRRTMLVAGCAAIATANSPIKFAKAQSVRIRRDINGLDLNDPIVQTYKLAVRRLHERDPSLEHSWNGQAKIHFDHCHRQGAHFLPWHRAYILAFEDIIREASGDDSWALPYWDWTENRQIPLHFFGAGSELDVSTWHDPDPTGSPSIRQLGPNDTLRLNTVDLSRIMNQRNFAVFDSRLDRGPHGGVHIAIGGHMGDFYSPLDPIFWLHHCNVDRLWEKWLETDGHENPSSSSWLDEEFPNAFSDPQGNLIGSLRTGDLLDTVKLGYVYDDAIVDGLSLLGGGIAPNDLFSAPIMTATNNIPSTLNVPNEFMLPASERVTIPSEIIDRDLVRSGRFSKQVIAKLSMISIPKEADNYSIRVFLNCPYLDPSVPPEDPHYVAEINLFGLKEMTNMSNGEMIANKDVLIDLTETLVALNARRTPVKEGLRVQTIAVANSDRKPQGIDFTIGRVDITTIGG